MNVQISPPLLARIVLTILVLGNVVIIFFIFVTFLPRSTLSSGRLNVSVLNIGQGDSILLQGPTGLTLLVDAGPDRSVLAGIAAELGPLNRHIDMIAETHPDADHIGGFIYVLENYYVSQFMTPGIPDGTAVFIKIENTVAARPHIKRLVARRGMRILLGGGAYVDILHPDRDMSKEGVTNDGSTTMHVVYGSTSFMLTGDLPTSVENWLATIDSTDGELKTDVLKVGHHGSKYSSGDTWLAALNPSIDAISVGKNNRYGHPASEALARMKNQGAKVYETENEGTIDFVSDGKTIQMHSRGL